ncbi:hypothetical protein UC35_15340 [Ramlibacter tataouinensis]|uniref:DUF4214 domain-containing protein n=2 Tax=Ramlibacter tataouinensis TaxID=94132 RepID=A0A127JVS5_9BURK|nr:hypothetical protein UC35_15340 [Ramlibacter tataouinensis]
MGTFQLTGDSIIDATTHGYYWVLGPDRTIDWAISGGLAGEIWNRPADLVQTIGGILNTISYFADVKFNYVGSFSSPSAAYLAGSEITITLSGSTSIFPSSNIWARGYFPTLNGATGYAGQPGDVFLNINSQANFLSTYAPGSAGWFVFLHELGHVLGLKHPHDDGGTGRPTLAQIGLGDFDTDWVTVMSYRDDFNWNLRAWDPITPMILDVLALQYVYGRNMSTNAGDSVLELARIGAYGTLWDSSGNDTVVVTNAPEGWTIVLPNIQLSSLVATKAGVAFPTADNYLPSPTTFYWLAGDIENANGSSYADTLIGSDLDNRLQGGAGNDYMDGGEGNDVFDWDAGSRGGADTMEGGGGDDVYVIDSIGDVIIEQANGGTDRVWSPLSYSLVGTNIEELGALSGAGNLTFRGNEFNNRIGTGAGADSIFANGGNDSLYGGLGNDTLDGGAGFDLAVFDRRLTGITRSGQFFVATSGDGVDQLINVERLQFQNANIALDLDGSAGQAYRLYQAAFNRSPDLMGLGFQMAQLDNGASLAQVAGNFIASPEFQATYGALNNTQFVTLLYQNVLHRAPDADGLNFWVAHLNGGMSRAVVLTGFSESPENKAALLPTITNGISYGIERTGTASSNNLSGTDAAEMLNGLAGNDLLTANGGDDTLLGGDGNDTLVGGTGNDTISGQLGLDIASYAAAFSSLKITHTNDGKFTVTDQVGSLGIDLLDSVERLVLSDLRVALDINGNGGMAYRLYRAAFDRTPDLPGLGFQIGALDGGLTVNQVAANFIASPEFQTKYGALTNTQYVTQLYQNVLHRAPDAGGLAFHVGNLNAGMSRADVLVGFSESPENKAAVIGVIQDGITYTV